MGARVANVEGLVLVGRHREALALAPALVADARALGYPPLEVRARITVAEAQSSLLAWDAAREAWQGVIAAAARAHDDVAGGKGLVRLAWTLGSSGDRLEAALALVPAIEAALARAGDPLELRADWARVHGDLLIAQGDYAAARGRHLEQLHLRDALGQAAWQRGAAWNGVAVATRRGGEIAWAEHAVRHAAALYAAGLGADHPHSAGPLLNLGNVLWERGRHAEAEGVLRHALATFIAGVGPDNPQVAMGWTNLVAPLRDQGKHAAALDAADRALDIKIRANGPEHASVASSLAARADALLALSRPEEAAADARRALAIAEKKFPPAHFYVLHALLLVADADERRGRVDEARAALDRAWRLAGADPARRRELERYHEVRRRLERR
jgi:tetratricopeptide (TPR) repeat protein